MHHVDVVQHSWTWLLTGSGGTSRNDCWMRWCQTKCVSSAASIWLSAVFFDRPLYTMSEPAMATPILESARVAGPREGNMCVRAVCPENKSLVLEQKARSFKPS